ncbi:unnamed protein product [Protopolystoma xenopodis]|uniref:Uncharacterized protein n=1 Tax=Protopolystoma xenopodis TaxID=117903 RepID=A0A3S5AAQ7_9PLAT|nr:unnamed protein product [Protopolystoma xenopodis]
MASSQEKNGISSETQALFEQRILNLQSELDACLQTEQRTIRGLRQEFEFVKNKYESRIAALEFDLLEKSSKLVKLENTKVPDDFEPYDLNGQQITEAGKTKKMKSGSQKRNLTIVKPKVSFNLNEMHKSIIS